MPFLLIGISPDSIFEIGIREQGHLIIIQSVIGKYGSVVVLVHCSPGNNRMAFPEGVQCLAPYKSVLLGHVIKLTDNVVIVLRSINRVPLCLDIIERSSKFILQDFILLLYVNLMVVIICCDNTVVPVVGLVSLKHI